MKQPCYRDISDKRARRSPSFLTATGLWHPLERALRGRCVVESGGRYEALREFSAPLGDEGLKGPYLTPVQVLRRGVRRCLNGRHARAGRSPRASEVGAPAENPPVDRASTRGTLGGHTTETCRCRIHRARRVQPCRAARALWFSAAASIWSWRTATEQSSSWLTCRAPHRGRVGRATTAATWALAPGRAQALAIVTRRDETASGLGRHRR